MCREESRRDLEAETDAEVIESENWKLNIEENVVGLPLWKGKEAWFFLVPEGRFSGGQEGDSWWDENIFKSSQSLVKWAFASLFFALWYYFGTKVSCAGIENWWLGMLAFHRQQISIPIGRTPYIEMNRSGIEMVHIGWHYVSRMRPCYFLLKIFIWRNLSVI